MKFKIHFKTDMRVLVIKKRKLFTKKELQELFFSVGWHETSGNYPKRLQKAMYKSDKVWSVWDGKKLIGLLSTMTDTMTVFLTYILINPSYQGFGIGSRFMDLFDKSYLNYKQRLTTNSAVEFYKEKGFVSFGGVSLTKLCIPEKDKMILINREVYK